MNNIFQKINLHIIIFLFIGIVSIILYMTKSLNFKQYFSNIKYNTIRIKNFDENIYFKII